MVIVDTTIWIDYFGNVDNAETDWLDGRLDTGEVGLTDLILCEYLQGVSSEKEVSLILPSMGKFEIFDTGGVVLAEASARNYRRLRSRGITVRATIDCLIATFCIERGFSLLHRDRDYPPFERWLQLRVVHPLPLRLN